MAVRVLWCLQFICGQFTINFVVYQPEYLILLASGATGALVKDILKDNKLSLPHVKGEYLYLGCIGGMILGALAGYFVDNDPVTAFLGGYAGTEIIKNLVNGKIATGTTKTTTKTNTCETEQKEKVVK
jgi:hypothetical protein